MDPVRKMQRVLSIDILWGADLLGLLLISITSMDFPGQVFWDVSWTGECIGWSLWVFFIIYLLIEGTMRSMFSMLFCLVNSAGLPASPFRTDHFKGITEP